MNESSEQVPGEMKTKLTDFWGDALRAGGSAPEMGSRTLAKETQKLRKKTQSIAATGRWRTLRLNAGTKKRTVRHRRDGSGRDRRKKGFDSAGQKLIELLKSKLRGKKQWEKRRKAGEDRKEKKKRLPRS